MSIILRNEKTTPLTFEEVDSNFSFLNDSIVALQSGLESGDNISDSYVRGLISAQGGILYDSSTGVLRLNSSAAVTSINGRSGDVVLSASDIAYTTDNIPEGINNSYYTDRRVNTAVKNLLSTGNGLTKTETDDSITITPTNFNIRLTGAVTGNATVSALSDVTIRTSAGSGFVSSGGSDGGVASGTGIGFLARSPGQLDETEFEGIEFDSSDFTVQATDTYVRITSNTTAAGIVSTVGNSISGTVFEGGSAVPTESGILVTYDANNDSIRVAPRDFTITIDGAVSGSATVSKLGDTTLTVANSSNFIQGLEVQQGSVPQNVDPVTELNFDADDFEISVINNTATIELSNPLTEQQVRDIIGNTVVGTERVGGAGTPTETGIVVNYDAENDVLEVAPRDFVVSLVGDVTGSATVSKLRDTTIQTTTSAIKGLNVETAGTPFLNLAKNLNFSNNFTLSKDSQNEKVTIDFNNVVDDDQIRTVMSNSLTGAQDGIAINYNEDEAQFSYSLSDLSVDLIGAVTGTGTISYSGRNAQTLTVVTEIGEVGSGLAVQDEGLDKGESVSTINFVGTGVTSSVTVDGQVATVNIPNSPAAEKFILIDSGSANVPNARRLQAGTGIILNDGGGGGDITISASGGDVLGKIQVEKDGELVAEEPTINVVDSQQVFLDATHDGSTNTINIIAYSKLDGWYRQDSISHGEITDKYGNSLDMGDIQVGIIEHQIDFGEIA